MNFCSKVKVDFDWIFPVKGHSYMPTDRSFSLVERLIKQKQTILDPEEYDDILKTYENLFILGSDVVVQDHKTASQIF